MTPDRHDQTLPAAAPAPTGAGAPDFQTAVRRFTRDENGQAMTEFVIVMPLFLFLVMAIMQFSLNAMGTYMLTLGNFYALRTAAVTQEYADLNLSGFNVVNDARQTARYVMTPAWVVKGDIALSLDSYNSIAVTSQRQGNEVQVQTTFNYPMVIPIARNVIGAAHRLNQGNTVRGTWGDLGRANLTGSRAANNLQAVDDDFVLIQNGTILHQIFTQLNLSFGFTTGTAFVRLPMTSNNRFSGDANNTRHSLLIARRRY